MKILLTGASGLVGSAFAQASSRRGHQVIGLIGTYVGMLPGVATQIPLDLTDLESTTRRVLESFPDAIVNCAAVSEPAACDAHPERSQAMNVALPTRLAELAHHLGARFLHLSSEQVFDGTRSSAYLETDSTSPINLYGRQKVASEQGVIGAAPDRSAIVRAPLLMGDGATGRRSVHERLFADWSAGRPVRLYTDELRQPCTASNLADLLIELAERPDVTGIFHWAGAELVSRYELGERIRAQFKLTERAAPIAAITRADTPDACRFRQRSLALSLTTLAARVKTRMQTISEQCAELRVPVPYREWYHQQK